jgi:hypothetical protein
MKTLISQPTVPAQSQKSQRRANHQDTHSRGESPSLNRDQNA